METYRGGSTNQGLRRLLRKYAEGGPFPEPALRDEDTYGPDTGQYRTDRAQATSDAVKAQLASGTGVGGALSRVGQNIADSSIVRGFGEIPGTVGNYFSEVTAGPDPSQRLAQDLGKFGSMVWEGVKHDPIGTVLDVLPVVSEIRSGMDASKYSDAAVEAEIAGDEPKASMFRKLAAMSTAGAAPILGVGARLAKRGAKAGVEASADAIKIADRELPIRPSTDNLFEVMDAQTVAGRAKPDAIMSIDDVSGGVDLSDKRQRARVDALKEKMESEDGHISRIIVDQDGTVIEGQHRLEALRELGATKVPVSQFEDLGAGINLGKVDMDLSAAQRMGGDNKTQLINQVFDALKDEGSVANVREAYEPPKGFEKGWNAILDSIEAQQAVETAARESQLSPLRKQNLETWFGDSVVKNKDGTPKTVYHGSGADFSVFRPSSTGEFGPGIYATNLADEASSYAGTHPDGTGQNVMPVYIRMEQPFVAKDPSDFWGAFGGKTDAEAMQNAQKAGYDGVIIERPYTIYDDKRKQFYQTGRNHTHYVVFDPKQIKSATGNRGTYDLKSPVITEAKGGSVKGYAEGGPVSSAAIYDPAEIDALAASIIEGNYA